ncbi:MAG: ABC transporter ATP-binding protein [Hyphomicrobiales bacterium]|nr:ABC transporter ATP-binding protein [Hyphomicrobiales bacterium]
MASKRNSSRPKQVRKESARVLMGRLYSDYLRAHFSKLATAGVCMVLVAAATATNAWLMQPVLDDVFLKQDRTMLMLVPAAVALIALVKGGASYTQMVMMKITGQRVITDMQVTLYRHLIHSDLALFTAQGSSRLISRFSNDIQIIRRHLSNILSGALKESVTLVFLIGVMVYQSWELSLIAFGVFPIAGYPVIRLGKRMRKVSEKTQEELGQYLSRLDDSFQGIRMVKAYNREEHEVAQASGVMERLFGLYVKAARTESAAAPIMELLAGIAIAAVIWYGGFKVLEGATTPGAFFSFIAALIMAYRPAKSLSGLNANLQEALAAIDRFYAMLDDRPAVQDGARSKPLSVSHHDVVFEQVQFSYGQDAQALQHVSFSVQDGKTVALVGPSGAGKSTIFNLLLRFYDPESGSIRVGGTDIRTVTLASLREAIAYVNQDATLFDTTIRENIAYGREGASEEEILEAAYNAAAHDFILTLPDGYETKVGQHGVRLSGGQRQRIAIARAMLRNAPILLLDEATSSLDSASEKQVQQALERLMRGRTTIVIAHRLATVMGADQIYVIDNGTIIEHGTHQELQAKSGLYAHLCQEQFGSHAA